MKTIQYKEALYQSMALKWQVIATYSVVFAVLTILAGIKYQGINFEYCGAIRYTEPVTGQEEAAAYNSIEKGTAVLIKIK